MKTDIAIDKLVKIAPIIRRLRPKIQGDEDFKRMTENFQKEGGDKIDFFLEILPLLLGEDYRVEFYEIVGIMTDKTSEAVAEQSLFDTINDIKVLFTDKDFRGFFSSVLPTITEK